MLTIAFWNVANRGDVLEHLPCLRDEHGVDVFLVDECPLDAAGLLASLADSPLGPYREEVKASAKVRAFTRLRPDQFEHRYTSIGNEMALWSVAAPALPRGELMLGGVHLPSKAGGNNASDQFSVAKEVIEELAEEEDRRGHANTVLAGDFNMSPYDDGMTSAGAVHSLMTRRLAERDDREHRGKSRRRFYNPMWGLLGDRTPGAPGSYYWRSSVLHNTYWQMLDQVLLRPATIGAFRSVEVLESDGSHSLCRADGAPSKQHLSDHLPLLLRLDL